jgi:oligopeptide/dipeptide ABC transporter ATP-binding protein
VSSTQPSETQTLLRAEGLKKYFPVETGWAVRLRGQPQLVRAVAGVDLEVAQGQTVAIVGESGSGKSTLGRLLLRLTEPTAGRVFFKGHDIYTMRAAELQQFRRRVQIIFQDPYASLNPRMRVGSIIREPLDIYNEGTPAERERRVSELLDRVGLTAAHGRAFPAELSGGQRQRVGLAAALALSPELIIADEPTSSLDVSVQAQILNILAELQQDYHLAFVFITHDLGVVQHFSDRVAVMYLGKIIEEAPTATLFSQPQHPYTQLLLSAAPIPDPRQRTELRAPEGEPPSPLHPPPGCSFHPRCLHAMRVCTEQEPELMNTRNGHDTACFLLRLEQLLPTNKVPLVDLKGDKYVPVSSPGSR